VAVLVVVADMHKQQERPAQQDKAIREEPESALETIQPAVVVALLLPENLL
jgi:hypothetical protein